MTAVRYIRRENLLGKLVRQPGGARISEVLEHCDANLAPLRDAWLSDMEASLLVIETLVGGSRPSLEAMGEAFHRANEIGGLAGVYGLEAMGDAAFSLCELLDHLMTEDAWNAQAVAVHLNGLRLLRSITGPGEDNEVLQGLRKVTKFATGQKETG